MPKSLVARCTWSALALTLSAARDLLASLRLNQQTFAHSLHTPASHAMPKAIITVEVRGNLITATTMGGCELMRTSKDLRGNRLAMRIGRVLGEDSKFKMVSPCAHTVRGNGQRVRTQFKRWRWHPKVHRVDPHQRLIYCLTDPQRADPVWKNRFSVDPPHDAYIYVSEYGLMIEGFLEGLLQKIPFDLGEAVMV